MTTLQKIGIGVVVILALLGGIAFLKVESQKNSFGTVSNIQQGQVQNDNWLFQGGVAFGNLEQTIIDSFGNSTGGFVLSAPFVVSTSTSVNASLTNNSGTNEICNGRTLTVYSITGTGANAFAPAYSFVLGTSTSATKYSANLLASTTVATSTTQVNQPTTGWMFALLNGSSVNLSVGDANSTISSSTSYTNWTPSVSVQCWVMR